MRDFFAELGNGFRTLEVYSSNFRVIQNVIDTDTVFKFSCNITAGDRAKFFFLRKFSPDLTSVADLPLFIEEDGP